MAANPITEKRNLAIIFGQPNPAALSVRVAITGEVQVSADLESGMPVNVILQPADPGSMQPRIYNLLEFAPISGWKTSASLMRAVELGWLFVLLPEGPAPEPPVILSGGIVAPFYLPMAIGADTDLNTFLIVGGFSFNAAEYSRVKYISLAAVTGPALTGEVQLFNITDNTEVALHNHTGFTTPGKVETDITLPQVEKVYEIRIRVTGGTPPTDRIFVNWAGLKLIP